MSHHKRGLARLISAVAAFALVVASVVGTYAHTGAHGPGATHAGCDQHHDALASSPDATPPGHIGASDLSQEHGDRSGDHTRSCDFACHGGVAILEVPVLLVRVPEQLEKPPHARSIDLLVRASLDRPPRPSIPA